MLELLGLSLFMLGSAVEAAPTTSNVPVFFPTYWQFKDYPKLSTDIKWGTPSQAAIPTIVDLGSANYWVYQAGGTINYGSSYLATKGPCNVTTSPAYNNSASKSASDVIYKSTSYAYGGNGKIINAYEQVNDTMRWDSSPASTLKNQRVALSNWTIIRQAVADASECSPSTFEYDHSILGLSSNDSPGQATTGPSFREDLFNSGAIQSRSMSIWMDKQPVAYNGTFHGSALFGAVPTAKYTGPLVKVDPKPPTGSYVGYYISTPLSITANNLHNPKNKTVLKPASTTTNCLIDSGTGQDSLPIDNSAFNAATGLILYNYAVVAYNGSCDSMPNTAALDFTFPASTPGKNVTISMPLRNYIRQQGGIYPKSICSLSLTVQSYNECTLAAPFMTALFMAANDDKSEIAIAQGGVSQGADKGVAGLGPVVPIKKGQSLPVAY